MDTIINNENHIVIHGWMVNELGLKGNDLLVYAIIYGFSQTEGQTFKGRLKYLATWTKSTKQGIINNLNNLLERGLIEKKDSVVNGVKFVEYYTTKFNGVVNKVEWGGKLSLTQDNILDNKKENISINRDMKEKDGKEPKNFVKPTLEEVVAYCEERNKGVNPNQWYDHYTSNGWKVGKTPMKDWKAAIRTWEHNNKTKTSEATQKPTSKLPEYKYYE